MTECDSPRRGRRGFVGFGQPSFSPGKSSLSRGPRYPASSRVAPGIKKRQPQWGRRFIGASGDTELFEKASNINGFQGGRVANNLYISPFRATVFKTAALFLYLNSSVVIRVQKPLFFPL